MSQAVAVVVSAQQALTGETAERLLEPDDQRRALKMAQLLEQAVAEAERGAAIENDFDAAKISDLRKYAAAAATTLERIRVSAKKPLLEATRALDAMFKPASAAAERVLELTDPPLKTFFCLKQEEHLKLLEAAVPSAETEHGVLDRPNELEPSALTRGVRGDVGTTSLRYNSVIVVDVKLVPRVFLEEAADVPLLRRLVKAALKLSEAPIPGVMAYEDSTPVTR